jgi:hypothetical protein
MDKGAMFGAHAMTEPARQRLRALLAAEIVVWIGLSSVTILVAGETLASEFPARAVALCGEGVVLTIGAALAGWALHRRRRAERADERSLALRGAMAVARVVVLLPLLVFALVVAAAGYSA